MLIITLEILRELASQRSKITKPLYSREELKSVSSNLFNFFHKHLENIEIHDLDEKETLKKLNEEANQTLIMF